MLFFIYQPITLGCGNMVIGYATLGEGIITEKVLGYIKSPGELIDQSWRTY